MSVNSTLMSPIDESMCVLPVQQKMADRVSLGNSTYELLFPHILYSFNEYLNVLNNDSYILHSEYWISFEKVLLILY